MWRMKSLMDAWGRFGCVYTYVVYVDGLARCITVILYIFEFITTQAKLL